MSIDRDDAAVTACRRFGLGARAGEVERVRADPRGAVLAQLVPEAARLDEPNLIGSAAAYREMLDFLDMDRRRREAAPPKSASMRTSDPSMGPMEPGRAEPEPTPRPDQARFMAEATARLKRQTTTQTPFVERLVNFWSNHFCVAAGKSGPIRATAGAYEREVIRPHVLGRFVDMLMASAHHPTMLTYLDNHLSSGPASDFGVRRGRGLNENLGREILELHTLGVDGGYTQADVTAFASALTGWSIADRNAVHVETGAFLFYPRRHQPGPVTIMGRVYAQPGVRQGEAALADFARHPSTAHHVARKLARHFVGDGVSPDLVARLARRFAETDGDLHAVATALVEVEEAWTAAPVKVMSPWDLLVATGRMLDIEWDFREANRFLTVFGQPLWNVPFPAGWPGDDDAWAAPAALLEMLDASMAVGRRHVGGRDVVAMARATLGPFLDERTREAVARADTREVAFALLVMSPAFLRR